MYLSTIVDVQPLLGLTPALLERSRALLAAQAERLACELEHHCRRAEALARCLADCCGRHGEIPLVGEYADQLGTELRHYLRRLGRRGGE